MSSFQIKSLIMYRDIKTVNDKSPVADVLVPFIGS